MNTVVIYPKNKAQEELILNFVAQNKIKTNVLKEDEEVYLPFKNFADKLLDELDKNYKKKKKA